MTNILLLALVISMVAVAIAVVPNSKLAEKLDGAPATRPCQYVGQFFPDPTSCEHFYQCDAGKVPQRFVCATGDGGSLCWDQRQSRCEWKSYGTCSVSC